MFKSYRDLNQEMDEKFKQANLNLDAFVGEGSASQAEKEKVNALREALKFVLSRPDRDDLSLKLLPKVRNPLIQIKMYDETLFLLATEALSTYKNEDLPVVYRATALFIMENLMAEARPKLQESTYMRRAVEKIRDADLEVNQDVQQFRSRNGLFKTRNPSKLAEAILKASKN